MASCSACRDPGPEHDREACRCLTCHGLYAATTDRNGSGLCGRRLLEGCWIRTGAVSGVVVVDVDRQHGGRLDPAVMPATALVRTGSGGWHAYYRHPCRCTAVRSRLGPGIDVRGDRGWRGRAAVGPPAHPAAVPVVGDHPVTGWPRRCAAGGAAPSTGRQALRRPVGSGRRRRCWPPPTPRRGAPRAGWLPADHLVRRRSRCSPDGRRRRDRPRRCMGGVDRRRPGCRRADRA